MTAPLDQIAYRLFSAVMAPLVLGGQVRPGHAIGAKAALALGDGRASNDPELDQRVGAGRLRRARRLVPVDAMPQTRAAEWALGAFFHDVLQSVNPAFAAPLRRGAAARILEVAARGIDLVAPPASVGEALSRHSWFARIFDVARTDTTVSWWLGARTFLGVEPPARLQGWPAIRRVKLIRVTRPLLDLNPIGVERARLEAVMASFLLRTPLTDLATCTRVAPPFAWHKATVGLVATYPGQTLALRALRRLATDDVDAALGRASRDWARREPGRLPSGVVALLAGRALAKAQGQVSVVTDQSPPPDALWARALGAVAARNALAGQNATLWDADRGRVLAALSRAAHGMATSDAEAMLDTFEQSQRNPPPGTS